MDHRRQKVSGTPSAQLAATGSSSGQSREKISGTTPASSVQFAVAGSSAGQPQSARWPMYNHPPDDPDDTDQQHDSDARNTTYPAELYTLDEFLAEEDLLDSFAEEIAVELKGTLEALQARALSRSGPRIYVNRPREEAHQQLVRDYFCDNPLYGAKKFRRRFRMRRPLFLRIVNALEYLRSPNTEDTERLLCIGEGRGFPGMLGNLDCMHWRWEKCPIAWKGQFTRGDKGWPSLILEAVASRDLRIWHAYFGIAGSNNDINVLNQSPLFIKQLKGQAPRVNFFVNDKEYQHGYYLVDGIYPEWAAFVKTISMPQTEKHKLFAAHQEGARKDVERAFGVLQGRFSILRRPARLYDRGDIEKVMIACIILHNMVVEDEEEAAANILDLNKEAGTSIVLPSVFTHGDKPVFAQVLQRDARIRDRGTHRALKTDLVEHIWKKFGPK
ncbi:hypothetical protein VPH35_102216 [Triticum aestivum]